MKLIPYNFTKITWIYAVALLCFATSSNTFAEMSPTPSKTVGGFRLVINNNTRFEIIVSDLVFASNEKGGERYIEEKRISPYTSINIEPGSLCPWNLTTDSNKWPCYWGNKQFRNHWFNIRGPQFEDPNTKHPIDISKSYGFISAQERETREDNGCCTYMKIKWGAAWKSDHWEITFEEKPDYTSRLQKDCIVNCEKCSEKCAKDF